MPTCHDYRNVDDSAAVRTRSAPHNAITGGAASQHWPSLLAALLVTSTAFTAHARATRAEPNEWNIGVQPQGWRLTRMFELHPSTGSSVTIHGVHSTSAAARADIVKGKGTQGSPALVRAVLDTGAQAGKVDLAIVVGLDDPDQASLKIPVRGWVLPKGGHVAVRVFLAPSEEPGRRFLDWWRKFSESLEVTGTVELLSIEDVANYKRLRELERTKLGRAVPSAVVAFIEPGIVLEGEEEVKAGLMVCMGVSPPPEEALETPAKKPPPASGSSSSTASAPTVPEPVEGKLEIWYFHFSNCRRCRQAREVIQELSGKLKERASARVFDATEDLHAMRLALSLLETYGEAMLLPNAAAFVGDSLLLGSDEIIPYADELAEAQLERGEQHWSVRRPTALVDTSGSAHLVTLVPVVLAGLADGVNPCAFAAMVLLISVLATARSPEEAPGSQRRMLLLGGGSFCVAVFTTYYLAGLGLLFGARELEGLPVAEAVVFWAVWALALIGGILSLADAIVYFRTGNTGRVLLKVPEVLRRRFTPLMRGRFSRYGLLFGGLAAGFLIAIMEGVCTGQMYLPTIQYMAQTPGLRARGAAYLLFYNALFMLPLVVILAVALAGVHFQRLNAFLRQHLGGAKLLLAAVFFMLAGAMVFGR